ncbi:MAG: ABC transporter ATP-binding protein [Planctomycetaceae bacterium]|nr:ABC transporter ATP-binding protein [Planctomycetaceae bacterium]
MATDPQPAIEVRGLVKRYGSGATQVEALRGVDLTVMPGEFVAVMGASGSGKSTLLHQIAALDLPSGGTIRLGGELVSDLDDDRLTLLRRQRIGFVFQAFNLLDVLTAVENVALPLVIDGVNEKVAAQRALEAMELVGIAHRRAHRPTELSGGEQQRVAIARALVTRPLLLLADEPTGNLDSRHGEQVMNLLRTLVDRDKQTIFMVTHDASHAALADRIVILRDGVVVDEQIPSRAGAAGTHDLSQIG